MENRLLVLSWAAISIFFQLYLKPAVHFYSLQSRYSWVTLFLCGLVVSTMVIVWWCCHHFFSTWVQASSISFFLVTLAQAVGRFSSTALQLLLASKQLHSNAIKAAPLDISMMTSLTWIQYMPGWYHYLHGETDASKLWQYRTTKSAQHLFLQKSN